VNHLSLRNPAIYATPQALDAAQLLPRRKQPRVDAAAEKARLADKLLEGNALEPADWMRRRLVLNRPPILRGGADRRGRLARFGRMPKNSEIC